MDASLFWVGSVHVLLDLMYTPDTQNTGLDMDVSEEVSSNR